MYEVPDAPRQVILIPNVLSGVVASFDGNDLPHTVWSAVKLMKSPPPPPMPLVQAWSAQKIPVHPTEPLTLKPSLYVPPPCNGKHLLIWPPELGSMIEPEPGHISASLLAPLTCEAPSVNVHEPAELSKPPSPFGSSTFVPL